MTSRLGGLPQVSVVMSTYNRGGLLADAIGSVLRQREESPPFELIVVDNNSTDETRTIIETLAQTDPRVRYLFEPNQGLSFARNAGVAAARAELVAFTDDDVRVEPDWVTAIGRAFADYPDVHAVGGRVYPRWPSPPPAWLTREHWAPLALADHGGTPIRIAADNPVCLVGANLAVRREVFSIVGGFSTDLQRVKDGIGSLEDHDFLLRLLRSGRTGIYDPRLVVHADIQPNRLDPEYHRRWHFGHGQFYSRLKSEQVERSDAGTLFGVPAHLYRQAVVDLVAWLRAVARRDRSRAFLHEVRLRFFAGFFSARRQEYRGQPAGTGRAEWRRLVQQRFRRGRLRSSAASVVGPTRG